MNKKIVILITVLILILAAGGFFWWQEDKIESFIESKKLEKMVAPSKNYSVREELIGKFVVNEKDGLKIKIPPEWKVELGNNMEILESDREITIYSKDFSYRPPEGCLIRIQTNRLQKTRIERYNGDFIMYPFEGAEEVKEMINQYKEATAEKKENMREKGIEIILVDQKETLRETTILKENIGKYVIFKIPTKNRVYIFSWLAFSEKCDEELNQFLETVLIK